MFGLAANGRGDTETDASRRGWRQEQAGYDRVCWVQLVTDNDQTHVKLSGQGVVSQAWPRILTVEVAAAYLGLSPKTIRNHSNRLPGERRWGDKVVFDRYEIDKMLDKARGLRSLWVDAEKARR